MVALAAAPPVLEPLERDAPAHFRGWFFAAVLCVVDGLVAGTDDPEAEVSRFPFLAGYLGELAGHGLDGLSLHEGRARWHAALRDWEADEGGRLPLRAIRDAAGLDDLALTLLLVVGLGEEDARFGALWETAQGTPGARRPTAGLLAAWEPAAREALRRLLDHGLIQNLNPGSPRAEWALAIPAALWEALRGERRATPAPGMHFQPPCDLPSLAELVFPDAIMARLAAIPPLLPQGAVSAVVVRGPRHSGRRTLLGALARELDRGLLEVAAPGTSDETRWREIGPLATALHALPLLRLDAAPGETIQIPPLVGYDGALGLTLGRQGGVAGAALERAVVLAADLPDPPLRARHWAAGFAGRPAPTVDDLGERLRLPGGTIRRAAALAYAYAALDGRERADAGDVRAACAGLNREALDTLATRLEPVAHAALLAVEAATTRDLEDLERRCWHRERIGGAVSAALGEHLGPGVRALFTGPSGTGKTLAARLLAAALERDLYRIDLAAVVNKYIGETEKRLDEVFSRAEELDVVLLLDEGDALLTARTGVQTANDRYANLETNFLLQRLESFAGILVVTTNAGDRIDAAFQRRMDVVVTFRPPGPAERWAIWHSHLPPAHAVDAPLLEQVARRCELHGGQIRNAVLHAALLALDAGAPLASEHLTAAVSREYRKAGAPCPLRAAAGDWG